MKLRIDNILYQSVFEGIAMGMQLIAQEKNNPQSPIHADPKATIDILAHTVMYKLNDVLTIDEETGQALEVPQEQIQPEELVPEVATQVAPEATAEAANG